MKIRNGIEVGRERLKGSTSCVESTRWQSLPSAEEVAVRSVPAPSCLCCPSPGPASAAVGLCSLIVVIQIKKCRGEQRGSFSLDQFPNPAYKMTAETAVRHWHERQGQHRAAVGCGGNF